MKKLIAMLVAVVMVLSMAVTTFAAKAEQTYVGQNGMVAKKISNPTTAPGEADGFGLYDAEGNLLETGDRGQNYAWAAAGYGDDVYVGTCFGAIYQTLRIIAMENGLEWPTMKMMIDVLYNGALYNGDADKVNTPNRSILVKINTKTSKIELVHGPTTAGGYRAAVEFQDKLYFAATGATPYLLEVDPNRDDATQVVCYSEKPQSASISTGIRGLAVYRDMLVATMIGNSGAYMVASKNPSEGQDSFSTICTQNDLLDYPAYHYMDSIFGGSIWDIIEYNDKLYITVVTGKNGDKQAFALFSGQPDENGKWTYDLIAGNPADGAEYPFGLGSDRSGAANLIVHNGYLYIGGYNDPMVALPKALTMEFESLYRDLSSPVCLWRLDKNENIEMVAGEANDVFPKGPTGNMGAGFGSNLNQYVWRMASYDGDLYVGTFDISGLAYPLMQFANGDVLHMSKEDWEKQINYIKALLDSLVPEEVEPEDTTNEVPEEDVAEETQPAEDAVVDAKPAEDAVVDAKPAEDAVVETQPAEDAVEETQPAEDAVEETQPAEETVEAVEPAEEVAVAAVAAEEVTEETQPAEEVAVVALCAEEITEEVQPAKKTVEEVQLAEEVVEPAEEVVEAVEPAEEAIEAVEPAEDTEAAAILAADAEAAEALENMSAIMDDMMLLYDNDTVATFRRGATNPNCSVEGREMFYTMLHELNEIYAQYRDRLPDSVTDVLDNVLNKTVLENFKYFVEVCAYLSKGERGFDLFVSGDGKNFKTITRNGLGDPYNHGCRVFAITDTGLCIGTANPFYGAQVWQLQKDIVNSVVNVASGTYDLNPEGTQKDNTISIAFNGNTVDKVECDYAQLQEGVDYEITEDGIVLTEAFLEGKEVGEYHITVFFNVGARGNYDLEVIDTFVDVQPHKCMAETKAVANKDGLSHSIVCAVCGDFWKNEAHNWDDGVCTECGFESPFEQKPVEPEATEPEEIEPEVKPTEPEVKPTEPEVKPTEKPVEGDVPNTGDNANAAMYLFLMLAAVAALVSATISRKRRV